MPSALALAALPAAQLRAAMASARAAGSSLAIPGAFNALCALSIQRAGFRACYVSGAATSVSAGVPDVGLLSCEHFCRCIREAFDASGLPVLADADTGFGEAEMVRRTVIDYFRAGAAGLHLEDQKFPKRCGHLDGKELVTVDHMVEKVQWASKASRDVAAARGDSAPGIIICARTDAKGVEGLPAAIARARAYMDAGAEMIFPEGLASEAEFGTFATQLRSTHPKALLLANMTEFGKTPIIPLSTFGKLGYDCVIFPVSLLRVAMGAVERALATLASEGSVQSLLPTMQTREQLYASVGYKPGTPWEARSR
jgi:methylisocitrate lyase